MYPLDQVSLFVQLEFWLFLLSASLIWANLKLTVKNKIPGVWIFPFLTALAVALFNNHISLTGLFWIILLFLAGWLYSKAIYRLETGILIFVLAFVLAAHLLPGFNNPVIFYALTVTENSVPLDQYLSIDKISAGLILFWFLFENNERQTFQLDKLKALVWILVPTLVLSFGVALLSLVELEIKWLIYFPALLLINLFFTCVAEEVYFRGLIQKNIARWYNRTLAIFVTGVLFGLAHFGAGRIDYILVAMIAGLGYAAIYDKTRSVGASILGHWLLNAVHLVFFTYPYLK